LQQVRVFDINRETAETYAAEMGELLSIEVRAVDSAELAVRDADVVVTVTVADEPIVKEAWIKPGSFFSAVGSYQEEEFAVVSNSDKVVVDGLEHVLHRETPIVALDEERIFFSPIGMGTEDVCVCNNVYKLALEQGVGTRLKLWGTE
jgi:ornithine cyclodeaminase/alanine dehydrogenase-like protein (mu-crystallin family)